MVLVLTFGLGLCAMFVAGGVATLPVTPASGGGLRWPVAEQVLFFFPVLRLTVSEPLRMSFTLQSVDSILKSYKPEPRELTCGL